MADFDPHDLQRLMQEAETLRSDLERCLEASGYEDLEHALLAIGIVRHALHEIEEHSGLGGSIPHTPDAIAHQAALTLLTMLDALQGAAEQLDAVEANEDLETALTALTIARGSFLEVAERFE